MLNRCLCILLVLFWKMVPAQQNVLILIADDLGADYCGFTPGATDTAKMPNIRNLLPKGVGFSNAWATPYCSSTRASMLTGRYSFRHGVGTVIGASGSADLDSAEISIAEMLKFNAPVTYRTANIGKWHINQQTQTKLTWPTTRFGYDLFKGPFIGAISDYYNWTKHTNGTQVDTITVYATTENVNDAIAWLDTLPANKPFFLWLAFNAPHTPYHVPPAGLHTATGLIGTPQHINANSSLYFKAMTEAMDTEIGRLLLWMKNNNRLDSTNIIFMGDNGNEKRVSQISDTTHTKGTLYDYGVHVPFLISGPAVVNPNRISDALVNVQDVFSTAMDLAGFSNWNASIPSSTIIDGKSLYPILKNQVSDVRDWAFTELFTQPQPTIKDGKTIRNKNYQLIRFDSGTEEFYHNSIDPTQQNNLLLSTMTATDTSNYISLCNYLNGLLGSTLCNSALSASSLSLDEPSIAILPNAISIQHSRSSEVKIYSMQGQLVWQQKLPSGNYSIATQAITPGIYVLHLNDGKSIKTLKWLKD